MTGQLIGYNARTSVENYDLFDIKKYYLTPGMKKELNLYGLYQNMEDIEKKHVIVIGESEKNVLKRDSRGDSTWVALSGKNISEEQVRIIRGLNVVEIVVALDKDAPIEEVWSICERFPGKKVTYIYDANGKTGFAADEQIFIMAEYTADGSENNGAVEIVNSAQNFPVGCKFVMEILGYDICNQTDKIFAYLIFPNAKLSPDFDWTISSDSTHPFSLKAMQEYCARDKKLFSIIIPE